MVKLWLRIANGIILPLPMSNLTQLFNIDGKVDGKQEPNAVPDTPKNKFSIGGCDLDGAGYYLTGMLDNMAC